MAGYIRVSDRQFAIRQAQAAAESGSSAVTRLSSGLRVNSAADDSAALIFATSLTARGQIQAQGIRNINDSISYLGIAESAVQSLKSVLTRVNELANQAASSTYTSSQRSSMNVEAQSLVDEYNRILDTTSFNQRTIFQASNAEMTITSDISRESDITVNLQPGNLVSSTIPLTRVTANGGAEINGGTQLSQMSPDGRYILFTSVGTNVVAGDTNALQDAFLFDRTANSVSRISLTHAGGELAGLSYSEDLSSNGRYVLFSSYATNVVASADTNADLDIFLRDQQNGTTVRISESSGGVQGNAGSGTARISNDGRYVVFHSDASNLVAGDTNAERDVFLRDTQTNTTSRISVSTAGVQANSTVSLVGFNSISGDGRYVVYESNATNLVAGDVNNRYDVFVRDTQLNTTTLVSQTSGGTQGNGDAVEPSISEDGRYVVFASSANNLVAGDTNGQYDVFLKDLSTGGLTRIPNSVQGNVTSSGPIISQDGRYVFFQSQATNLVSGDTNGVMDAFVYDTQSGTTRRVSTSASGTEGNSFSNVFGMSADGQTLLIASNASNLVTGDLNGSSDIFFMSNPLFSATSQAMFVSGLSGIDVSTEGGARSALTTLAAYSRELGVLTGNIGAGLARAGAAVTELSNRRQLGIEASNKIMSSDVGEDVAGLVRSQTKAAVSGMVSTKVDGNAGSLVGLITGVRRSLV